MTDVGCFVTSGHRFGGDFIVYHEDPSAVHAMFVVSCVVGEEVEQPMLMSTTANRVAESCRKKLIMAFINNDDDVEFIPLGWSAADARPDVSVACDNEWDQDIEEFRIIAETFSKICAKT